MKHRIIRLLGSFCAVFGFIDSVFCAPPATGWNIGKEEVDGFCNIGGEYMYYTTGILTYYAGWPNGKYTGDKKIWIHAAGWENFRNYEDKGTTGYAYPGSIFAFDDPTLRKACFFPTSGAVVDISGVFALTCLRSNSAYPDDKETLYSPSTSSFSLYGCCEHGVTGSTGTSGGGSGLTDDVNAKCPCFYASASSGYSFTGSDGTSGATRITRFKEYKYSFINCNPEYYQPTESSVAPYSPSNPYYMVVAMPAIFQSSYGSISGCVFPNVVEAKIDGKYWCSDTGCYNTTTQDIGYKFGGCSLCPRDVSYTNLTNSSLKASFLSTVGVTGSADINVQGSIKPEGLYVKRSTVGIESCDIDYMYTDDSKGRLVYDCYGGYSK